MLDKAERERIHLDWWGKCRTCRWWNSTNDRPNMGEFSCFAEASTLYLQRTTSSGYCTEWDSFDIDTAIEIMQEDEK